MRAAPGNTQFTPRVGPAGTPSVGADIVTLLDQHARVVIIEHDIIAADVSTEGRRADRPRTAELEAAARAPHVICDRSALDNYCYLVNKFGRQPQLEQWLAWWMDTYSLLVAVPPME